MLTAAEAHELLAGRLGERAGDEAEAADQLIESCSRLPLALSIVAARAAARPFLPLTGLARELADAQGRLDALDAGDPVASVRAVFSWSCEQLSETAARLFRLLGLHPGPDVSIAAAASLAALEPSRAAAAVAELADAHLIAEHAPGRYAFHDLLRAYAADLASRTDDEAERRQAVHRVLDHYLHSAYSGSLALNPTRAHVRLAPPQPGVSPGDPELGERGARLVRRRAAGPAGRDRAGRPGRVRQLRVAAAVGGVAAVRPGRGTGTTRSPSSRPRWPRPSASVT